MKHSVTKLVTDDKDLQRYLKSPFYRRDREVLDAEDEFACYVVTLDKKKIVDSKPVHVGDAILQWSKYLFIR